MNVKLSVLAIAMLAVGLCAGCGAKTGDAEVDTALGETGFDKAPPAGELARKLMVAQYLGDGEFLWENLSAESLDAAQKTFENEKGNFAAIDDWIKEAEQKMEAATTPEEKALWKAKADFLTALKAKLPEIASAKDYFLFLCKYDLAKKQEAMKKEITEDKIAVVKEQIILTLKNVKTKQEVEWKFVWEGDAWKLVSKPPKAPEKP